MHYMIPSGEDRRLHRPLIPQAKIVVRKMPYDRFVYFKMTSASRSACLKKFAALVMIAKAPCISGRITVMKARCCDGLLLAQVLKYAPAGADQGMDCHRIAVVGKEFASNQKLPPRSADLVYPNLGHPTCGYFSPPCRPSIDGARRRCTSCCDIRDHSGGISNG